MLHTHAQKTLSKKAFLFSLISIFPGAYAMQQSKTHAPDSSTSQEQKKRSDTKRRWAADYEEQRKHAAAAELGEEDMYEDVYYAESKESVYGEHERNDMDSDEGFGLGGTHYAKASRGSKKKPYEPRVNEDPIEEELVESLLDNCPTQLSDGIVLLHSEDASSDIKPKQFLFVGPPGTGKTSLGKAIAQHFNMPFFMYNATTIENEYRASGPQNIERIFEKASQLKRPCVIIIDEIEGLFIAHNNKQGDTANIITSLWNTLDKYSDDSMLFICTTNDISKIPAPFLNRLENDIIEFSFPSEAERKAIIEYYIQRNKQYAFDDDFADSLAQKTKGYSARSLMNLVIKAARSAVLKARMIKITDITPVDISRLKPFPGEVDRQLIIADQIKQQAALRFEDDLPMTLAAQTKGFTPYSLESLIKAAAQAALFRENNTHVTAADIGRVLNAYKPTLWLPNTSERQTIIAANILKYGDITFEAEVPTMLATVTRRFTPFNLESLVKSIAKRVRSNEQTRITAKSVSAALNEYMPHILKPSQGERYAIIVNCIQKHTAISFETGLPALLAIRTDRFTPLMIESLMKRSIDIARKNGHPYSVTVIDATTALLQHFPTIAQPNEPERLAIISQQMKRNRHLKFETSFARTLAQQTQGVPPHNLVTIIEILIKNSNRRAIKTTSENTKDALLNHSRRNLTLTTPMEDKLLDAVKKNWPEKLSLYAEALKKCNGDIYDTNLPRRIMLVGPIATGKSSMGKALADLSEVQFYDFESALFAFSTHDFEKLLNEAAQTKKPCIVMLKNMQILATLGDDGHPKASDKLASLHSLLNKYERYSIIFVGVFNKTTDEAVKQLKTQFKADYLDIQLPNEQKRTAILQYYMDSSGYTFKPACAKQLAKKTDNFSLMDLEYLVRCITLAADQEQSAASKASKIIEAATCIAIVDVAIQERNSLEPGIDWAKVLRRLSAAGQWGIGAGGLYYAYKQRQDNQNNAWWQKVNTVLGGIGTAASVVRFFKP